MDSDTFDKALELLPLIERGFMSCAFEPTIHPDWLSFLKRIPKNTGAYTFITTNLSKYLTDDEIYDLSETNLDAITVSMTSLKQEVYEEFHKGSKFNTFLSNLMRLAEILKRPDAPDLRFITIVFKQNLNDLVEMAEKCYQEYAPILYQFRTVFPSIRDWKDKDWLVKSIPSKKEWLDVSEKLAKLPYKDIVFLNPLYPEGKSGDRSVSTFFSFRSNGKIIFNENRKSKLPIEFRKDFNINDIDKPYEFFKKGLAKI